MENINLCVAHVDAIRSGLTAAGLGKLLSEVTMPIPPPTPETSFEPFNIAVGLLILRLVMLGCALPTDGHCLLCERDLGDGDADSWVSRAVDAATSIYIAKIETIGCA